MNGSELVMQRIESPSVHRAWYLIKRGSHIVGFLEKLRNTGSELHPWKAFLATPDGTFGAYLGARYEGHAEAIQLIAATL